MDTATTAPATEYEEITIRVPAETARLYEQADDAVRQGSTRALAEALAEAHRKARGREAIETFRKIRSEIAAACTEEELEEMRQAAAELS